MSQSFEDFQDLSVTGYQGGSGQSEQKAPEDEFFHSVYISGQERKNHLNIIEEVGKFQIRGVQYNLDEVNMVITHTKDILVKEKYDAQTKRQSIECSSYKDTNPWVGSTKLPNGDPRQCPTTSPERSANAFCNGCKAQIIVAGILCEKSGTPILSDDQKPIFVFIRGKGTKYSNVSDYLNDRFNEEGLSPIFEPVTEQTTAFEKAVVNNKRFVVTITKGRAETNFGIKTVFDLNKGVELPKEAVMNILKLSKDVLDKFNDKFDWSKRSSNQTTGYGGQQQKQRPEGILDMGVPVDDPPQQNTEAPQTDTQQSNAGGDSSKTFSFDGIKLF